jgi:F-type H+-transporting ATPase subunit delta
MEEIAQVYARSLFEVAKERGKVDEIREELGQLSEALEESRDLSLFLFSPYFSTEEKKEGLHRVISDADESLVNFLELLLENHRLPALHRIRREYDDLWREENQLLPVQVTSAVELDDDTIRSIGDRVGEQTGRTVELSSSVDPDLVGGIVLRVGNSILDASIRNRLEQLRKQVARA